MRAHEFLSESYTHDAVMYKAPHMMGHNKKMVYLNAPGTLGRQLVSFTKNDDGTWRPSNEEAERYFPAFLKILKDHPDLVADDSLDEMALPANWDPTQLGHDKTFKNRLAYARERAQRLGAGSSRVAFIIPDQGRKTVLKIAKNRKGLAQNEAEAKILTDGYLGKLDIVIPLIDYDRTTRQPVWIQTELANFTSEPELCGKLKCTTLTQFCGYVGYILHHPGKEMWKNVPTVLAKKFSESDVDQFLEYANEMADLANSSNIIVNDFQFPENWGIYKGRPVVIDLGFTEEVYKLYRK